jgi:hypothetical protein
MADTRRAMRAITASNADPELVAALLSADSNADAVVSFTLLRDTIPDDDLVQLANLREVLFALPEAPFRTGEDLDLLARSGGYEVTARSHRRCFESSHGVFGLEFAGHGRQCEGIFVHTPACRMQLEPSGEYCLDPEMITLFVRHHIVLDALLEALGLLGLPLDPAIYVTVDDFLAEHGAAAVTEAFGDMF